MITRSLDRRHADFLDVVLVISRTLYKPPLSRSMCSDSLRRKNDRSIPFTADCPDPIVADHYQLQAGGRTLVRREVVGDPGGTLENGQVSEAWEERMLEEAHPVILGVNLGNRKEIHPWSIPLCSDRG